MDFRLAFRHLIVERTRDYLVHIVAKKHRREEAYVEYTSRKTLVYVVVAESAGIILIAKNKS